MQKKIEKVLLVDDDANIRLITEMSLEGLTDWKIVTAESGDNALEVIAAEKPQLVILDMMMPDMDGITCFSEIQKRMGDDAPIVIFMTAKVQSHEVDRYKSLGAAGVISKPFEPMTLADEINALLEAHAKVQSP